MTTIGQMSKADLKTAIKTHGSMLQGRADWLRKMVERQQQQVENAQKTLQHFADELVVVEQSIEHLRREYREALNGDG